MASPSLMGMLGSAGLGLVWGWMIGSFSWSVKRPRRNFLSFFFATVAISAEVVLFSGWVGLSFFTGAALPAFFARIEWRRKLIQSLNP